MAAVKGIVAQDQCLLAKHRGAGLYRVWVGWVTSKENIPMPGRSLSVLHATSPPGQADVVLNKI